MRPIIAKKTVQAYFVRIMLIAVSAMGTLIVTSGTAAACGPNGLAQPGIVHPAPIFPAVVAGPAAVAAGPAEDDSQRGIVGLWHVNYTDSTGALFYEAYDMWHADGNEWETSFGDPRQGNYCLGVWKKVGPRTVQLRHFAWIYNSDGTPAGYFILTETDTVSRKGDSYTGTFDYKQYDVNGNFQLEVTGTQAATRFKV
jgi:hypothetical protein